MGGTARVGTEQAGAEQAGRARPAAGQAGAARAAGGQAPPRGPTDTSFRATLAAAAAPSGAASGAPSGAPPGALAAGVGRAAGPHRSGLAAITRSAALALQAVEAAPPAGFADRIALRESSAQRPGQGYGARNPRSGALGRYQITPQALRDLGWQDAEGRWTPRAARHGAASEAAFLASPAAQEAALAGVLRRNERQLDRNGSLARAGGVVTGLDGGAVPLTEAGLVAAAHRRGAGSVARYLAHRTTTPDAQLGPAERRAFAAVEGRLREFADLPYALARRAPPRPAA